MAPREQGDQALLDHGLLAEDDAADGLARPGEAGAERLHLGDQARRIGPRHPFSLRHFNHAGHAPYIALGVAGGDAPKGRGGDGFPAGPANHRARAREAYDSRARGESDE
ncbi:hypothetical protein GCM10010964_24000 [Caldovatus sediminis]|uniref:Uncharacterized protein n=1 Tax=Caldovatus sediminis TaxID=2041189 RepID=A0A8J2ZBQ3_9PROT|nr:hypothetical protein GCM10010964_24000 [Caldovatus sediminis]